MIRQCRENEADRLYAIINEAAKAYDGEIEPDCYHQPYMPMADLQGELKRVTFYGYEDEDELVGVMGIEPVKDVTLIRHAYVLPQYQNRGIGKTLLKYLINLTTTRHLLVGTWGAAHWAITFYLRNGFTLMPDKDRLLSTYWDIPPRQIETSVVMGREIKDNPKESV
jgi:GNAT superfamily N-acetyltransferase